MKRIGSPACCCLVLLTVLGCGGAPSINGTVTYEGEPIRRGSISFAPSNGQGAPVAAAITDGSYRIPEARVGSMRVAISGYEVPEAPPGAFVYDPDPAPPGASAIRTRRRRSAAWASRSSSRALA